MAAVAGADLMLQGLDLLQVAAFLQIGNNGLSGFHGGHACILAAVQDFRLAHGCTAAGEQFISGSLIGSTGHVAIIGEDTDNGQVVALADLKVIGVMGRSDLDNAGTLGHVGMLVADNGDFLVQQGQDDMAAVQMGIAGVFTVDSHSGIAQHGLRTGGSQFQHFAGFLDRVQQMPEIAVHFLMLDLGIGDGGVAVGAPVDQTVATVDLALFIQTDKNFLDGIGAAFVHGEAFPVPVTAGAKLLQLLHNSVAELVFPFPGTLQETVTADHILGQTFLGHGFHNLCFGSNGSVVSAGNPQSCITLHTLGADQDILHGVVHGVAHVELAGDIGGRHYDGEGLLVLIALGVEIASVLPHLVDSGFYLLRVVDFR